jgi:CDP-paratose 2-epimerase
LGDGKENSCSILEAFDLTETFTGKAQTNTFVNRRGDHICYSTGPRKRRAPYPKWDITESLEETFGGIVPL